jgi:hypothetical protein
MMWVDADGNHLNNLEEKSPGELLQQGVQDLAVVGDARDVQGLTRLRDERRADERGSFFRGLTRAYASETDTRTRTAPAAASASAALTEALASAVRVSIAPRDQGAPGQEGLR